MNRKFDTMQQAYDNMTPEDDPCEGMTEDEIEYAKELEAEAKYESGMEARDE
jgi:hypothetical protein